MVFPVVTYRCESWAIKKAEYQRMDVFKLWCWRRLLRVLWTARRWNHSNLSQFNHSVVSDSLRPHELQHTRPPCPSPTPGVHPNPCPFESVMLSNHLILCRPLLLLPSSLSQHQGLFKRVSSSYEVAKVLEFQLQHQSFQWTPRTDLL